MSDLICKKCKSRLNTGDLLPGNKCPVCDKQTSKKTNLDTLELDILTSSPADVAEMLSFDFPESQATALAMHVYQPLRKALRAHIERQNK